GAPGEFLATHDGAEALPIMMRQVLLMALACGCGGGVQVEAKHAADFRPSGTMSVLGIFRDGRMSADSWNELGDAILPRSGCEPGYNDEFVRANSSLAGAIDDYVRANGVTDGLLDQLAPLAEADAILVLSVAGHPPRRTGPTTRTPKMVNPY